MVRRTLIVAERWQSVGMLQTGFSNRRVAGQTGIQRSVIDHLRATGMVERPRSGRPSNTTSR